ncbi:MAG TPA: thiamine pyrophosphate-binding protein [Rhodospirillaceae bacterium]|nr:thiamine pyrophosphate-binding protein [Rhodospirillaceae bacterium]
MGGNAKGNGDFRTGGQVLIDQLRVHGVDTIFCLPGESYLAAMDAMHDAQNDMKIITCRQEGGVTNMADAYAKLTGKPGIAMVTRAPGACNASIGVHTAMQDSLPMVIFIGQVARDQEYREAFQEVDYHQFYGALCKWVVQLDDAERIPELVSQAFHRAMSGRPGPVAVAMPEDMLRDLTDVDDASPFKVARPGAAPDDIAALRELLEAAERPLAVLGGGGWSPEASANFAYFASANQLPVSVSFRCQDFIDNEHPCYVGELGTTVSAKLASHVEEADLLIAVGARMGEMTTSIYGLLDIPTPKQKLVHVYMDPTELGRVYTPTLPIVASMESFAKAVLEMKPVKNPAWADWTKQLREEQLENWKPTLPMTGDLDMHVVMEHLNEVLPDDAILTNDAGNFSGWPQRFYHYREYRTQLAPTSGAMGYGIPAAIAARSTHPNRIVVGFVGDGGAMMSGQEFAAAVHHGIDPIILVINNNLYGTIRMHQDRDYPGRDVATALTNPDFAKWSESFGGYGEIVERTDDFAPAFERALNAGKIALLELRIDPDMISTRTTLSALREAALAKG